MPFSPRRNPGRPRRGGNSRRSWRSTSEIRRALFVDYPPWARLLFEQADPGPPPGGEPDLVVSANCLSQLGLVPGHSPPAAERDEKLPDACAAAAARRHLDWLPKRSGVQVLFADFARFDIAPEGRVLKRENLRDRFGLRSPDRAWRWELAPIPEWSLEFHRVHEVGMWIDGATTSMEPVQ